jgi:hypothetical protein
MAEDKGLKVLQISNISNIITTIINTTIITVGPATMQRKY